MVTEQSNIKYGLSERGPLSQYATVTGIKGYDGTIPNNVIDGDVNTFFRGDTPQCTIDFDFGPGKRAKIDNIRLAPRIDNNGTSHQIILLL